VSAADELYRLIKRPTTAKDAAIVALVNALADEYDRGRAAGLSAGYNRAVLEAARRPWWRRAVGA
jgi:hypothetical protein